MRLIKPIQEVLNCQITCQKSKRKKKGGLIYQSISSLTVVSIRKKLIQKVMDCISAEQFLTPLETCLIKKPWNQ